MKTVICNITILIYLLCLKHFLLLSILKTVLLLMIQIHQSSIISPHFSQKASSLEIQSGEFLGPAVLHKDRTELIGPQLNSGHYKAVLRLS